jgi:hypothetical protein
MNLDAVLTSRPQWIVWQWQGEDRRKVPVRPNSLHRINPHEPLNWMTLELAEQWVSYQKQKGVELHLGFVLTPDDPIICVDLDGCRNPTTGEMVNWAITLIGEFDSYTEFSPSGSGVKIFIRSEATESIRASVKLVQEPVISSKKPGVEVFSEKQFVAITGESAYWNDRVESRPEQLARLRERLQDCSSATSSANTFRDNPDASEDAVAEARRSVEEMPEAIDGARGHNATFAVACRLMIDYALSFDQAMEIFVEYNERCTPPWEAHELKHKLRDAGKRAGERGWRTTSAVIAQFMEEVDMTAVTQCAIHSNAVAVAPAPIERGHDRFQAFPTELLPSRLRTFVTAVAAAIGCDESFVALPVLAACAGAIGNSRCLLVKEGWTVGAILWCVLIGESGTQKSPPLDVALQPLKRRQHEWAADYQRQLVDFRAAEAAKRKKVPPGPSLGTISAEQLTQPIQRRCLVSDATIESLVDILHDNPRGVLLARDELVGWIASFDKYSSKGSASADVGHWLSIYSGKHIVVDRKTGDRRSLFVPHPAVSICGSIQPGTLKQAIGREHRENGLMARLLLTAPPRRQKQWSDHSISPVVKQDYEALIEALLDVPFLSADGECTDSTTVRPTRDALDIFIEYVNLNGAEQLELTGELAAAWSKLEETAARLALVIHCVRHISGETDDSLECDSISMQIGVSLAAWFKNEFKRLCCLLSESPGQQQQRELSEWIANRGGRVRLRELVGGMRSVPDVSTAERLLQGLVQAGLGTWSQSGNVTGPAAREFVLQH